MESERALGSMQAMPRKRATDVHCDRLWSIINKIVDMDGMSLSKVCEEAGIAKRGSPYETVRYWWTGRKNQRKGKDEYQQPLPLKYRRALFILVSQNPKYQEEYLKPLQPRETWLDADELWTWLEDFTGEDFRFERQEGLWMDVHDVLAELEERKKQEH
jgi:hypothetical protein